MLDLLNPPIRIDLYTKPLPPQNSVKRARLCTVLPASQRRISAEHFRPASTSRDRAGVDSGRDSAGVASTSIAGRTIHLAWRLCAAFERCIEALFPSRRRRCMVVDVPEPHIPRVTNEPAAKPVPSPSADQCVRPVETPYANYEVTCTDRDHILELSNSHRGLNSEYYFGGATSDGARNRFFATRETLLQDATQFLVSPPKLPAPKLSLPENATASDMLRCGLEHRDGIAIGEWHSSAESKKLLIDNMSMLAANGVKILYLEHLLSDFHQAALDEYNRTGDMPAILSEYLDYQDHGHHTNPNFGFRRLVEAAHEKGIAIVALDCMASYRIEGMDMTHRGNIRGKMFSYFSQAVIAHHQERPHHGERPKWVALVGNTHTNTFEDVPGLAELTGAIGIRITPSEGGERVRFDPGAWLTGGLADRGFTKADYELSLPRVKPSNTPS